MMDNLTKELIRIIDINDLKQRRFYTSISLSLFNSIYSIGAKYTSTLQAVTNFACKARINERPETIYEPPKESEEVKSSAIQEIIKDINPKELAEKFFCNSQRTSTKNGILKAEACKISNELLVEHKIFEYKDLSKVDQVCEFERDFKTIPGQRSGISFKYFMMLTVDDNQIKPDRHVIRFLEGVLERKVCISEAESIIKAQVEPIRSILENDISLLQIDSAIWRHMRDK